MDELLVSSWARLVTYKFTSLIIIIEAIINFQNAPLRSQYRLVPLVPKLLCPN
jgi:hypothetical protein